ncbi:MAG TPA: TIGR01777 family protein [Chlorobaculum parvum]|uniref:TIGR01777 family protein n=1 Tax=Chlorobaculum parvum TaxID=274539 RepID=A0A7C5DES3_9CHLB|nr:TIGR01777 family protein [Chlorobaculum parvum]
MDGHIVITGATGVIGKEVAKRLISSGRKVVVFARSTEAAKVKVPGAAAYVHWDSGMATGEWTKWIDGAYGAIHLAGKPLLDARWTEEHKQACYDSRIDGTRALVAAMTAASVKPQVFLSSSAIGYYGSFERCQDTPQLGESGAPGQDFLAKICFDWEKEAIAAEKLGIRVVRLRTGIVLSTKGGMLQKMMTPFDFFIGGPIGSGQQCISWIHLDDEVGIILESLDNEAYQGPVNGVAPEPVSMKVFAETLGAVMHRPSLLPVPKLAVQVLMGEGAEYAVTGQNVKPEFLEQHGFPFAWAYLNDALGDLISRGI